MTTPRSIRFDPGTLESLASFAARRPGLTGSSAAALLVAEGLRMDAHPGIVFREGPTGRRAVLVAGPDVWEVIRTLRDTRSAQPDLPASQVVDVVCENTGLRQTAVRVAMDYYGAYPGGDRWARARRGRRRVGPRALARADPPFAGLVKSLLLDEMLSPRIAEELRMKEPMSVASASRPRSWDGRRRGPSDVQPNRGGCSITDNIKDFVALDRSWAEQGREHPGILFVSSKAFPQDRGRIGRLVAALTPGCVRTACRRPGTSPFCRAWAHFTRIVYLFENAV